MTSPARPEKKAARARTARSEPARPAKTEPARPLPAGWCVYLLRCGDGSLYCGMTNDLEKRLKAHREGKGARYTRGRGPLEVVYREKCEGKSEALKRERAIKGLPRLDKLALCKKRKRARFRKARGDLPSAGNADR